METVMLEEYLKEREAQTWLLTFAEDCKSAEVVDEKLVMHLVNEGDEWDIMSNNSISVYLILLQGLAVEIGRRMDVTIDDFKINYPGDSVGAKLRGETIWK